MSENNALSGKRYQDRITERYSLRHRLDTTLIDEELPGEIIDWSKNGIQVYVKASLSDHIEYGAMFRIHRGFFVADEKYDDDGTLLPIQEYEDDNGLPSTEKWEGTVQWVKRLKDWVALGISFEESLEGATFEGSPRYIMQRDLCQMWLFPKSEELLKHIEVWIENPENLEVLKQYSRLNESEVINTLVTIVAEGINQEDEGLDKNGALNRMVDRILEVFVKTS